MPISISGLLKLLRFNPILCSRVNVPGSVCANDVAANNNDRDRVVDFFI